MKVRGRNSAKVGRASACRPTSVGWTRKNAGPRPYSGSSAVVVQIKISTAVVVAVAVEILKANGNYDFRGQPCDGFFQCVELPLAQTRDEHSDLV